jgi:hypothetical protein
MATTTGWKWKNDGCPATFGSPHEYVPSNLTTAPYQAVPLDSYIYWPQNPLLGTKPHLAWLSTPQDGTVASQNNNGPAYDDYFANLPQAFSSTEVDQHQ